MTLGSTLAPDATRHQDGATRASKRPRGFTLIEVVIASTIFLIGFAGVMTAVNYSTKAFGDQQRATTALSLAEEVMEDLTLRNQSDALLSGTHSRFFDKDGTEVSSGGYFQAQWTVTPGMPVNGLRRIDLRVSWTSGLGARSVKLGTVRR